MSLFVCPSCGYQDSSIWKSSHWRRYSVYANVSEVEVFFPHLLKELKESENGWVWHEPYWYQINKKRTIVNRMTQQGRDEFKVHGFTEKRKVVLDSCQRLIIPRAVAHIQFDIDAIPAKEIVSTEQRNQK